MNILAIDTSTSVASVSLSINETVYTVNIDDEKTHSQKLLPIISNILKEHNLTVLDIDNFIAGNGPGSFTGIRIGVSSIKGLAHVANKNIFGVSTLDILAYSEIENNKYICSIIDARNMNAYYCIYKVNADYTVEYVSKHDAAHIDEIIELAQNLNEKVMFVGSGAITYADILNLHSNFTLSKNNSVDSANLIKLFNINKEHNMDFINRNTYTYHSFNPIYLRPSQAERLMKK
ncbi:MAG: tRNA (adenosine(37)-N6)-threonylcarbamoyltransferase complex dimerization subunit type 1 TsaB [Clostridia bacterium]